MNKILAVFAFIAVLQFVNCQDKRLANCVKKFTSEIYSLNSLHTAPDCFDEDKLAKVVERSKSVKDEIQEITESYKEGGLSKCLSSIMQLVFQHQDSIKSEISEFLDDLIGSFANCTGPLQKKLSTLDDYVKNGCPDE